MNQGWFNLLILSALSGPVSFASAGAKTESLPVFDNDFGCTSPADADRYIRDFGIDVASFGGRELCRAEVDTKKLLNDLELIEKGHFSGDKKNLFIRDFLAREDYYGWAKQMTRGIERGHDIPWATAYNSGGYFTMQDGWTKLSTLGRVGTLLHEARHTEGYGHVPCDQGPYAEASLSGCDDTLREGGSHGIEMEYYSRVVLQGENFHPIYQQMARLMNLGRANFVFNDQPLRSRPALVAQSAEAVTVINGAGSARAVNVSKGTNLSLKRTSLGASLFSGSTALAVDTTGLASELLTDEYSYYKLLLDGRIRNVVDLEEVDIGVRRYLVALTQEGRLMTYVFAQGRWSSPTAAPDVAKLISTAPSGEQGLFVVTNAGEIFPLNPQNLRRGSRMATTWPASLRAVTKWNDKIWWVDWQGQIVDKSTGTTLPALQNQNLLGLVAAPGFEDIWL